MSYRLYTTYFHAPSPARRDELDLCVSLNASTFSDVYVVSECESFGEQKPVGIHAKCIKRRQTYADLLNEARQISEPSDIVVIANTDIIFPRMALDQIGENIQPHEAYALSRWDLTAHGIRLFDKDCSQDAWIFRGPPRENIGGDYPFGHPGVDNKFAHELDAAGYTVLNPSKSIRTYHLHLSGHRPGNTAANRVAPPYLFVGPHRLGEQPVYRRPEKVSKRASIFQR